MTSTLDWMGRRVSEIEAAAYQRALNDAVKHLLAHKENWQRPSVFSFHKELDRLANEILDLKDKG